MVLVATQVKRRRGTTAENDAFTGAEGEITVDLGNKELRVHTGDNKVGGYGLARKDFENITDEAKNISNWSSNVSNCITNIPQDIKLELADGVLTLKAGSKVYVPNGAGTFDELTIQNDLSSTHSTNETAMLFVTADGTFVSWNINGNIVSGSTYNNGSVGVWYDTTNNRIRYTTNSGSTWSNNLSLPLCIFTISGGAISSIDQVFNGFGYIGSTVFVLPGVKGLLTNGTNADGSLNNIPFVVEKPLYQNIITADLGVWSVLRIENGEIALASTALHTGGYNPNTNYNVFNGRNSISCIVTREHFDSNGKITSFTPKSNFHAVDYSDTEFIAHQAMQSDRYIDLTLGATGASYTAPSDGWVYFSKTANGSAQYVQLNYDKMRVINYIGQSGQDGAVIIPVPKLGIFNVSYTAGGTTKAFRFIYANGAK